MARRARSSLRRVVLLAGLALPGVGFVGLSSCKRQDAEAPMDQAAAASASAPATSMSTAKPAKPSALSDSAKPGAADGAEPLAVGDPAPDVSMTLQDGKTLSLSSLKGEQVVVYFYPKDNTPGCTVEAQGFRDDYEAFRKAKVRVLGVSLQDAASHQAFIEQHELPFDLVVDTEGKVARAFGVPTSGEYASRQTFLIGADGKVKQRWLHVDPGKHSKELLDAIEK